VRQKFVPVGSAPGFQARELFCVGIKIKFPFYSLYGKNIFDSLIQGNPNRTYTKSRVSFLKEGLAHGDKNGR
jgi:hypothetical protein